MPRLRRILIDYETLQTLNTGHQNEVEDMLIRNPL